jgi:nitroreductase
MKDGGGMEMLDALRWRYAVKRFLPGARDEAALTRALEAARLAPSSFGLQPWRIVLVEDAATRARLAEKSYGQAKVAEAGHLAVFAILDPVTEDHVAAYVARLAAARGLDGAAASKRHDSIAKTVLQKKDAEERRAWARAQCYLGLGVFLAACAAEGLDACPMEGFEPAAWDEILGLADEGLAAAAAVPLGRRAEDDAEAAQPKVRMPAQDLILRR